MRKRMCSLLVFILLVTMMPIEAFAYVSNPTNDGDYTNTGQFDKQVETMVQQSLSKAFKTLSLGMPTISGGNVTVKCNASWNTELKILGGSGSSGGTGFTYTKTGGYYDWTVVRDGKTAIDNGRGNTVSFGGGGSSYKITCEVHLTYSPKNSFIAGTSKSISTSKKVTITYSPQATLWCTISGPGSGLTGKTYTYTGSEGGGTIKTRSWQITNSKVAKLNQSGKTAKFSTTVPSPSYNLRYIVTDASGRTAYCDKTINIASGVIADFTVNTPVTVGQKSNIALNCQLNGQSASASWVRSYTDTKGVKYDNQWPNAKYSDATFKGSGFLVASKPGTYHLCLILLDQNRSVLGQKTKDIVVTGGLQAAIDVPSVASVNTTCKAKDVSTYLATDPIAKNGCSWSVVEASGRLNSYTTDEGGAVILDTSKTGTAIVTLTVKTVHGNTSTTSKKVKIVATPAEAIAETPPPMETTVTPPNVPDLIKPDIPDKSFDSNKVCVDWAHRGQNGPCEGSAKVRHLTPVKYPDLKATGATHEYDTKFQYMKVTIKKWTNDDKIGMIWYNKNGKTPERNGGVDSSYTFTFTQVGHYTVHLSQFWYYEYQHREMHSHTAPKPNCNFTMYDGGACIEENNDMSFDVVVTFNDVGKKITFDSSWSQSKVGTESYFLE